jgi:hypothetical protein
MSHLHEVGHSYLTHLLRAWKLSFVLFVHGLFPEVWKTKASDELCKDNSQSDATRAHMLKSMYGIEERRNRNNNSRLRKRKTND